MLFSNTPVYASNPGAPETSDAQSFNEPTISDAALVDKATSSTSLSAYAVDTNVLTVKQQDKNGVEYTITIKYDYTFNGETCGQVRTIPKDIKCDVTIPEEISLTKSDGTTVTYKIRSIADSAFESSNVTSITLPSTIREIGSKAFLNCKNLTSVKAKSELYATDDDGNIITENLTTSNATVNTTIGDYAFSGCSALKKVSISGFREFGDYLFKDDTALTDFNVSTKNMKEVRAGKELTSELTMTFGKNTFENCTALTDVTIPDNVKTLGASTFQDCTSLETVSIGATLTSTLNSTSFTNCNSLEIITVSSSNKSFSAEAGVLYNKYETTLIYCPVQTLLDTIVLSSTVTKVDTGAFRDNANIESFTAQGAVTLGDEAFINAKALKTVEFQDRAVLGNRSFQYCTNLQSMSHTYLLVSKSTLTSKIGDNAFEGCSNLVTTVETFQDWTSIGTNAFKDCNSITDVTTGYGIGTMGKGAFENCISLQTADLTKMGYGILSSSTTAKYTFDTGVFKDCTSLVQADLPLTLQGISSGTFQNCSALKMVTVGESAGRIANAAFDGCTSLEEAPYMPYLVRIDEDAFNNCASLKDITLTRSVQIIDDNAFSGSGLKTISTPLDTKAYEFAHTNGYTVNTIDNTINDEDFLIIQGNQITGYRGGFESLTIPDTLAVSNKNLYLADSWINNPYGGSDCSMKTYLKSIDLGPVNYIGTSALSGSAIESVDLGDNVYIFNNALSSCKNLTSVSIPATTEVVGSSAFASCTSLTDLTFEAPNITTDTVDSITDIDTIKFRTISYNKSKGTIDIGDETKGLSTGIFSGCTSLTNVNFDKSNVNIYNMSQNTETKNRALSHISYIPESCFKGCTSLSSITLPYNCLTIGKTAFQNCKALAYIEFSPATEDLEERAFDNCTSLTTITLEGNMSVGTKAFSGCKNISTIIVPGSAKVPISNAGFVDTISAVVYCAADSNNVQYFQAFNNPEDNADLFLSQSDVTTYKSKGYTYDIQYVTFADDENTIILKSITIPNNVTVTCSGQILTIGSLVKEGDILTIIPDGDYTVYVNGEVLSGTTYIVPQNTDITIMLKENKVTQLYGDVDCSGYLTAQDAAMILQHVLSDFLDEDLMPLADVDNSGSITANDAAMVLQKVLDSSYTFPVEQ
jgi:hypothetical protein